MHDQLQKYKLIVTERIMVNFPLNIGEQSYGTVFQMI